MAAEISDEAIAALRARIGVPQPHPQPPHYRTPNEDAFRHVAEAYGDDNPLWCDPAYGATSRWGGPIAPPHLVGGDTLIGEDEVTGYDDETKALMKGDPLRGVARLLLRELPRVVAAAAPGHAGRPAQRPRRRPRQGGRVRRTGRARVDGGGLRQQDGPVLAAQYRLMIRAEREKARGAGKYDDTEIRPYTDEEIERIDRGRRWRKRDRRRGAEPRWWEDVAEGDELEPAGEGPDPGHRHGRAGTSGMGMGLYGVKALRLGYQQRQQVPRFFRPDDLNVPDVQQRVHWDAEWARRAGNPAIYDYGRMRETWLIHLCTDWMGDDAWLWKLDCQFRKLQLRRRHPLGAGPRHPDATWTDWDRPAVDLDLWGENQRGETTTPGHASILLPSREHGEVRLPPVPGGAGTAQEVLEALVERFADEEASS